MQIEIGSNELTCLDFRLNPHGWVIIRLAQVSLLDECLLDWRLYPRSIGHHYLDFTHPDGRSHALILSERLLTAVLRLILGQLLRFAFAQDDSYHGHIVLPHLVLVIQATRACIVRQLLARLVHVKRLQVRLMLMQAFHRMVVDRAGEVGLSRHDSLVRQLELRLFCGFVPVHAGERGIVKGVIDLAGSGYSPRADGLRAAIVTNALYAHPVAEHARVLLR